MRRRRAAGGPPAESISYTLSALRSHLEQAAQFDGSETELPPVPDEAQPDKLAQLTDAELKELEKKVYDLRKSISGTQNMWKEYSEHLRSALDAALMIVTLKSEQDTVRNKRRRTGSAPNETDEEEDSLSSPGRLVAFKLPRTHEEVWIQCEITKVLQEGQKFEVRDTEPDENNNPGKVYRANVKDIIFLPAKPPTKQLYSQNTVVLARYPETTAFYRARVCSFRHGKYKLRFEGEDDLSREIEVPASLVIKK